LATPWSCASFFFLQARIFRGAVLTLKPPRNQVVSSPVAAGVAPPRRCLPRGVQTRLLFLQSSVGCSV
jgi:hypothetical protein